MSEAAWDFLPRFRGPESGPAHLFAWSEGHANRAFCDRWFAEHDTFHASPDRDLCVWCQNRVEKLSEDEEWRQDMKRMIEEYGGPGYGHEHIHPDSQSQRPGRTFTTRDGREVQL